jgi:hypothetical protein
VARGGRGEIGQLAFEPDEGKAVLQEQADFAVEPRNGIDVSFGLERELLQEESFLSCPATEGFQEALNRRAAKKRRGG